MERRAGSSTISPGWLLVAASCYFLVLLLSHERLQLLLLAALAFAGIALLNLSIGRALRRMRSLWMMFVIAGVIHLGFRWWLTPSDSVTDNGLVWLDESLFFTARLALFLLSGITVGMAHSAEAYVSVVASAVKRVTDSRRSEQAMALVSCAWRIIPSIRDHHQARNLARKVRRIPKGVGLIGRLRILRSEFFALTSFALRHADALALSLWSRQISVSAFDSPKVVTRVIPAVACGVFCFLCLSILPL